MKYLFALVLALPSWAVVTITANSPAYNWQVLPGSVRRINAFITGGTGNLVNWSVLSTTGGASATLSASTNALATVDVTIGSGAGTCSIAGTIGTYSVSSTASVTVQVQSVDDVSKTATFLFNVCNPAVQVFVVPFYRTLYANQRANLQSYIIGSSNLGVTWSITASPGGGNGSLDDTGNRDAVFHASVAGRYTLTATSSADGTKTGTATIFVTGNALPYNVTPNKTEPVDCTTDPSSTGTVYEVGPARAFTTIASVPMNTMPAGSTVRIHNDDMTGTSPTTYAEYFQIGASRNGTATQPLRVVGCPDSLGNLPILNAVDATGASWVSTAAAAGFGIASIWPGGSFGYYPTVNGASFAIVEGLHLENAQATNFYVPPNGGTHLHYVSGVSCLNLRGGQNVVIVGNEMDNCENGTFSDANLNSNAWGGMVLGTLWEGNYIHGSGVVGGFLEHQLYIQGWLQVAQFNRIDLYKSGADGSVLKSRGIGDVIRYNFLGDGAQRVMDLIDLQDSSSYETFEDYLGQIGASNCNTSFWCSGPDTMGPNVLAGWQEAFHQHFVYGNTMKNTTAQYMIHFGEDHDDGMANRLGTLYWYNNTMNLSGITVFDFFDNSGGGGNPFVNYETQKLQAQNSIFWVGGGGFFVWNYKADILANFATNLLFTGWGNITTPINGGSINGHNGNGWSNAIDAFSYPLSVPLDTHMTGLSGGNFLTTSTQPFDSTTYLPVSPQSGTVLAAPMDVMPVRFMYQPNLNYAVVRNVPVTSSAAGTIGALDAGAVGTGGSSTFGPVRQAGPVTKF